MKSWVLGVAGIAGAGVALAVNSRDAGAAASQAWPAFVLVAGLLLVGLVAAEDGLFAAAGAALRRACPNSLLLFCGMAALIMVVSAVLNLDTAVAFLTPVAVSAGGRSTDPSHDAGLVEGLEEGRPNVGAALLPACILLSNAGSLLLPGSNLTNLIVVTHARISGGSFASRMFLPWIAVGLVTAGVVAVLSRDSLRAKRDGSPTQLGGESGSAEGSAGRPRLGVGAVAIGAAVAAMLLLGSPSLVVLAVGVAAVCARMFGARILGGSVKVSRVAQVLNLPVLVGLMGLATAVGTLGRLWSGPSELLGHLDPLGTAVAAAVSTVLINNLPAASLLSARAVTHPLALLVGLDVGPNLFVSGSLAWVLWLSSARACGVDPGLRRALRIGVVAAPLGTLAGVAALMAVAGGG